MLGWSADMMYFFLISLFAARLALLQVKICKSLLRKPRNLQKNLVYYPTHKKRQRRKTSFPRLLLCCRPFFAAASE